MELYDALRENYDLMTRFDLRLAKERRVWRSLVDRLAIQAALDVGCGTGLHSILMSEFGVAVIGIDASEAMIELARKNAARLRSRAKFVEGDFCSLFDKVGKPVEAAFCMGNTIAHLLDRDALVAAMHGLRKVLKGAGVLVIQLLNYTRILAVRDRFVGATQSEGKTFLRFYDFDQVPLLRFNVLVIEPSQRGMQHQWLDQELYAWQSEDLLRALEATGFKDIQFYSDLSGSAFEPAVAKDLVIIARV